MSTEDKYQTVRDSPLGRDLSEDECRTLVDVLHVHRLADGEVLVEEGAKDDALHLLASGKLAVTRAVVGADPFKLHTMNVGELAGAMGFVDGMPRSATLRAIGDTVIYSLERDAFESLVEGNPRLVYHIMRAITRSAHTNLLEMNKKLEDLTNYVMKQHGRY